jgi:two-component system CheB/CheR fusion protein
MGQKLQKKVLPLFHYSLNRGGYLILGTSESIGEFSDLFATVDRKLKIFQRRESDMPGAVVGVDIPPLGFPPTPLGVDEPMIPRRLAALSNKELAERALLDTYRAAGVLINEKGDILYFHGPTGRYLEPPVGEATLNVLTMAREGLKLELANTIRKAVVHKDVVHKDGVRIKANGDYVLVNVTIRPISEPPSRRGLLMVIFTEVKAVDARQAAAVLAETGVEAGSARIKQLEHELASTKEYLQTTIEELETTNEELKSTNEELQSANEELQSTNEELETAKEEQQSINEELVTVNSELQQKIDALSKANDDMNNLLASIQIGTIFLDTNLNIQRFTPAVTKIINLIDTDVGRPLRHIVYNLQYPRVIEDAEEVLATLRSKEMEVSAKDGHWYLMRMLPYRTTENVIEGVVITFVDISDRKKAETELLTSEERYRSIGELVPYGVWIASADGKATLFSESFLSMLGMTLEQCRGFGWTSKVHPADLDSTLSVWKRGVKRGVAWQCRFRIADRQGKYKTILSRGVPLRNNKGEVTSWAGINMDVSDEDYSDA